ncbi:MAG TPA: hypothetical protein VF120_17290 [Ktedonobacterales bacterium]
MRAQEEVDRQADATPAFVRSLQARIPARIQRMRGALSSWRPPAPESTLAVRLTLVGLVIALQNLLELPRELFTAFLGLQLTSLLVVMVLAASLVLLLRALALEPPSWAWLRSRRVQTAVLVVTLAAALLGVKTAGSILVSGFRAPYYPNDGTTLDHYAALELLHGHNPYVTTDIVAAIRLFHQDPTWTTPLHRGVFADSPWTQYPTHVQVRQIFAHEPVGQPERVQEFESRESYPALAFLALVPVVWAGLPSVVLFFALCLIALAVLLVRASPPAVRPFVALLLLADASLLDATVAGDLDVFYILLLFIAWRYLRRPLTSTLGLGLALAAKQLAWFFLPYYAIAVARKYGWREAMKRTGASAVIFVLINAPFILNNPRAWAAGVLAPEMDPMFPMGNGLVRLSTAGLLPLLPAQLHLALEAVAFALCLVWYARSGWRTPEVGFVLAVVPLFFAWRSLTTYFYFVALPAIVLLLARSRESEQTESTSVRTTPQWNLAERLADSTTRLRLVLAGRR